MKFIILLLCLIFSPFYLLAQDTYVHQKGDILLSAGFKSDTPGLGIDWGEFNVENQTTGISHDAKLGDTSIGGELLGLYFLNPYLALGVSFGDEYFPMDEASGLELEVSTRIRNYLAVGRVYLNPEQKYKIYIPFGVGVADISAVIDMSPRERFNYAGFAANLGMGVERLMSEHWVLGGEFRYNYNRFHRSKTTARGEYIRLYPAASYISMVLWVGYKL